MSEEKKVIDVKTTETKAPIEKKSCGPGGCPTDKLKAAFAAEDKDGKLFLTLALAAFASTFLPWMSFGYGGIYASSMNAWVGFGFITGLSSLAILLLFILPIFGITIPKVFSDKSQERKIFSIGVIASPVIWLIQSISYISMLGIGLWITLAIGAYMVYMSFAPKK